MVCVTKLINVKDGVGDKVVCERWLCDRVVWGKMVVDKVVCERWWLTKLYVKDGV